MRHTISDEVRQPADIDQESLWNAIQQLDSEERKQVWQLIKALQTNRKPSLPAERAIHIVAHQAQMPHQGKGRRIYTLDELKAIADAHTPEFEWNYERLRQAFPTEPRIKVELIEGQLYIYPNELATEPEIVGNIGFLMLQAIEKTRKDDMLFAPIDLVLDDKNIFQPSICFIAPAQRDELDANAVYGVPELILEIVSSTEAVQERETKRDVYEAFGVKEYWEVRPDKKRIEVEVLQDGEFVPYCKARRKGKVSSSVIKGFTLAVEDVFERD